MNRSAADAAVLSSTVMLLRAVRSQTGIAYADDIWSPVSTRHLSMIAHRFGAALCEGRLAAGVQEIGIPGYVGSPVIVVNHEIPPGYRALALRHGLAHLVAGELEPEPGSDIRFMSSAQNWMCLEERRADLFALVDLIPDRDMQDDPEWLTNEIALFASDWQRDRLSDRVALRLALWRI